MKHLDTVVEIILFSVCVAAILFFGQDCIPPQ